MKKSELRTNVKSSNKVDNDSNPDISDKTSKTNNRSEEELLNELTQKVKTIKELQINLKQTQERLHDVIVNKKDLEKRVNNLELKELSLEIGKFHDLMMEYDKLEHRTQITKKQLDDAREHIKSREIFVSKAKDHVEFMEKVIEDLENRGLTDYLRKRFPESFLEYKKI